MWAPAASPRLDAVSWLILYVVLLFGLPSRLVFGPMGSAGAPSAIFGLLSLAWWLTYVLSRPTGHSVAGSPVRVAMWIFTASVCVSYVVAMSRPINGTEASSADRALLSALSWLGIVLLTTEGVTSAKRLDDLVRMLTVVAGALALLGLAQFITERPIVDALTVPGLTEHYPADNFTQRQGFTRPSGTATHPIEFGVLMTMLLPFTLHQAFHGRARSLLLRWGPVLLSAAFIPLSSSRSAILGAAAAILVLLPTWNARQRVLVLSGGGALLLAVFVAVPGVLGSLLALFTGITDDPSARSRVVNFDIVTEFFGHAPLLGRGLGTFLPVYRIFDNQYIQLLLSVGVLGLLAFIALIATVVVTTTRVRHNAQDPATRDLAQTVIASLTAGALSLAFFDAFSFPMTAGALFLVIGIAGALWRVHAPTPTAARHALE